MRMKGWILSAWLIALSLVNGCTWPLDPVAHRPAPYTPQFSSNRLIERQAGTAGITIALVKPTYATDLRTDVPQFASVELFRQSLAKETESILIAKGFNLLGPFADLDDMTFPQRKQSDLILRPVMAFSFESPKSQPRFATTWLGKMLGFPEATDQRMETPVWRGPCTISGFINFAVLEPISSQKMWVKKMEIGPLQEDCSADSLNDFKVKSSSAVGKLLEKVYPLAIEKADLYFNGEEMGLVKKQSLELREKKVY